VTVSQEIFKFWFLSAVREITEIRMDFSYRFFGVVVILSLAFVFIPASLKAILRRKLSVILNYFTKLVDHAKKDIRARGYSQPQIVETLENQSKKIESWYKGCLSETDDESDNDSDSEIEKTDDESSSEKGSTIATVSLLSNKSTQTTSTRKSTASQTVPTNTEIKESIKSFLHNNEVLHDDSQLPPVRPAFDFKILRIIQSQICRGDARFKIQRNLKAPLVICTDGNAHRVSGYCLNFTNKTCQFFIFPVQRLPWLLKTKIDDVQRNRSEVCMASLTFALILWKSEIMKAKKYSVYSGSFAISQGWDEFSKCPINLMEHLGACGGVIRVNNNVHVSKFNETDKFAQIIQPAWDLSQWGLMRFKDFVSKVYDIQVFHGSHLFKVRAHSNFSLSFIFN
jgi:hypothetical protein